MEEAVQERRVHRIDADLEGLQPVAVDQALEREGMAVGRDEAVEGRQRRRRARAHIGEQDAALLDDRIGLLLDVGAEVAVVRLGRRLEALAVHVEQPAVKRAAQAAILEPAVGEVGAAMRTVAAYQAIAATIVPEDHQILAEQADRFDRPVAVQLRDQGRRLPIAPHQVAGRRARAGARDEIVLFLAQHGGSEAFLNESRAPD